MNKKQNKNTLNILSDKVIITRRILNNDMKISNIFNHINKESNKDLDKIIHFSNERINFAKKGNNISKNIDKYFNNEIKMKSSLSSKMIYLKSNMINEQKNKFSKSKIDIKEENQEIKKIFDKIRENINPSSNMSIIFQKNKHDKKNNKYSRCNNTIGKEIFNKISNKIKEEKKNINNNINDYLQLTKDLKEKGLHGTKKRKIIDLKLRKISSSFELLKNKNKISRNENDKNHKIHYIKSKIIIKLTKSLNPKKNKAKKEDLEEIELKNKNIRNNSLDIVKNEITNQNRMKINFLKKLKRFDKIFHNSSLPNLDEYSSIINERRKEKLRKKEIKEFNNLSEKNIMNKNTYKDNFMSDKFYNDMSAIYKEKSLEWEKENKINTSKIKNQNNKKNEMLYLTQFHSRHNSNISHSYNLKDEDSNYNNNINNNSLKRFNHKYYSRERMSRNNKQIIEEYKGKIIKLRK